MRLPLKILLPFLLLSACTSPPVSPPPPTTSEPTLIKSPAGSLQGTLANNILSCKGIPFAQPPLGPLRWKPPQPLAPWPGTLYANDYRPNPIQLPLDNTSEDCLYLNIFRPAAPPSDKLPVVVWIYGGALIRGGATIYPGENLARHNLVVVTFNYRLGRLGFFAHPALATESPSALRGNYGYMDQLAALHWVQRNIRSFGGDPTNVTIAGESAGGGSVLVHLASPLSRGLFHRAILQSPGIPTPRAGSTPMTPLPAAESIALDYARTLNIPGTGAAALASLRALSAEKLAEGTEASKIVAANFGGPQVPGVVNSIIDGTLVPGTPESIIRAGHQASVPVLCGANDRDLAGSPAQNKDDLFAQFGPLAQQARTLYDPSGAASLQDLIQNIIADRVMVEPSRNLCDLIARSGQPAYFYRFSYVAQADRGKIPGAAHGADVPYMLDTPEIVLKDRTTDEDRQMAHLMSAYWAAFIKTGNPNGNNRPTWPRYTPSNPQVLNFTNTTTSFGPDPIQPRLDLWRTYWQQVK